MHKKNTQKLIVSLIISITILAGVFGARHAFAQAAKQIEVSAYILDNQDQQVPNQNYDIKFALYTEASGGTSVWSETQTVPIQNGIIDAYLGAKTPLPDLNFGAQDYYLGITIGTDSEMTPRKQIASVPSAYNALNSLSLNGAQVGTNQGDILALGSGGKIDSQYFSTAKTSGGVVLYGSGGKIDIKSLPTGTGSSQLVLGNDSRLSQISNMLPLSGGNMTGTIHFSSQQTFGGATESQVGMLSGITNPSSGDMLYFSSNGTLSVLPKGSDGTVLQMSNGQPTWVLGGTGGMVATNLLSIWHSDTTPATVVQGGLITGQGNAPTWSQLAPGTSGQFLKTNGASANLSWSGISASDVSGLSVLATESSVNLATQVSGMLAIGNGGTGAITQQAAIDALTDVSGASANEALMDISGHAVFAAIPGGFTNPLNTIGQIMYQDSTNTTAGLSVGTNGQILTSNGTVPTWATLLSVGQGGTGATTFTSGGILYGNGAGALQATGHSGSANQVLMQNAAGAPFWGSVSGAGGLTGSGTGSGTINYVAVWSGAGSLGGQQYLAVANGGTGAGNAAGARTNLGLGTLATSNSVDLSSQVVNTLAAGNGGTGITTYATGDILYASATNALSRLTAGAQNSVLMINSSGIPFWGTVSGAGAVSVSGSPTSGDLAVWSGSTSVGKLSPGANGTVLTSNGTTMSWAALDLSLYAHSGANSDITSLTGLTTALPVSEGGTGLSNLSDGSMLYYLSSGGDSLAALTRSAASNQVLMENASGAPYWGTVSGAGGLTGSGTNNYVAVWSGTGSIGAQQYLAVANGGTGSGTGAGALTNLGAQAANANLTAVSGGTWTGDTHIATVGTISSGTWNGSVIGATYGGTGLSTYSAGDILYASAANTLSKLPNTSADGKVLMISPTTHLPVWTSVSGAGSVTGSGTQNDIALWGSGGNTLVDGTLGNGLAVGSNTLGVSLLGSGDSTNHKYSTSGLQFSGANNQLTLLQGCTNGQILKWDSVTNGGQWYCSDNLASSTAVINVNGQTNISEIDFDNNFQENLSGSTDNIHLAPAGVTLGDASNAGSLAFTSADYGYTTIFTTQNQNANIIYKLPVSLSGSGTKYLAIDAGSGAMTWTTAGGTGGPGTVTDVAAGNGLATNLTGGADITNSGTLNINLFTSTYADPGVPSSSSGLQFDPTTKALTLLQGCGNGQVLAYNNQSDYWYCSDFVAHAVAVISVNDTDNIQQIDFNTLTKTPTTPDFTFNVNGGAAAVGIDYANSGITRSNQSQAITSPWSFTNSSGITLGVTGSTNTPGVLSLVSAGNNTNNNYTTTFTAGNQNANINYTLPTTGGGANKFLTANASGAMSWTTIAGGTGGLGTITSVSAGAGLSSVDDNNGAGPITSSGSIAINLLSSPVATGTRASVSGMEIEPASKAITLLQGCNNNEVLAWNGTAWACASVTGGSGLGGVSGSGTDGQIALWSSGTLTGTSTLGVTNGGTGTGTAFTQGSLVFAGASGVYSQDNANFFWDSTNHRLGLGNTSPASLLSVGSASQFQVDTTGNISTSGKITSTNSDLKTTNGPVYAASGELKSESSVTVAQGGTGATTLTGMLEGNGASAFSAVTGTSNYVAYWSSNNAIGGEQYVGASQGGTGLDGSSAGNGKILIGNGTGYTLATITQGTGIGVTNAAGSITINNAGVTSIGGTAHEISASASTGSVTLSLPQQIDTTSSPTFAGLTLNGNLALTGSNTITISNTSTITNLNADMLDGYHASSFLQAETDPIFSASAASGIASSDISNWNSAYAATIGLNTGAYATIGNYETTAALTTTLANYAQLAGAAFTGAISSTGTITGSNLSGTNTGDETLATIKSKLGITTLSGSNTGDVTLSGQNYLSITGQAITANAVDLSGANATGTLAAGRFPAMTGDITNTAGSVGATISAGAVSLGKMANLAADSIIGNNTGSAATPAALTVAQVQTLLGLQSGAYATISNYALTSSLGTLAGLNSVLPSNLTATNSASNGYILTYDSASGHFTWSATASSTAHALLDGNANSDTTAGTVVRGDLITGQGSSPTKWTRLAAPSISGSLFSWNGTDSVWNTHVVADSFGNLTAAGMLASSATTNQLALGTGSNILTISATAPTGNQTLTIPSVAASGNFVIDNLSQTLSNKTISAATINGNLTGSGTPTISSFGTINGATLSGGTLSATSLAGTGPYTITGGTNSGDTLTLISSSNATKGNIQFFSPSNTLSSSGNLTIAGTMNLANSNSITGVTNYAQFNNGISVGGGTTYNISSSGSATLGIITSGAHTVISPTATAFSVAGTSSNYGLQVDESASSAVTGLKITANSAGNGLALSTLSTQANENLTISAKGTGNVGIGATTFGTSAAGILALGNGTAPTTSITGAQIWSTTSGLNIMGSGSTGTVTLGNNSVFNAASTTTGNLLNIELGGTSEFSVDKSGNTTIGGTLTIGGVTYTMPSAQGTAGQALVQDNTTPGLLKWGSVVPTATGGTGAIQFANGSNMNGDAATSATSFFWDDAHTSLGIGTNTPYNMLQIYGANKGMDIYGANSGMELSYDANDNAMLSSSAAGELLINTKYNSGGTPATPQDSSMVIGYGSTNSNNTAYTEYAGGLTGGVTTNYYSGYDYNTNTMRMGPQFATGGASALTNVSALTISNASSTVGYVGIGTEAYTTTYATPHAPGYPLEVSSPNANAASFYDVANGTSCTVITTSGGVTCSSDSRLKKNVVDLGYGLSTLMTLKPVQYNWKTESDGTPQTLGFIAQDVQQVIPQLVTTDQNGYEELNTIGLIPVLAKSIQDEEGQITSLTQLTNQNTASIAAATTQETTDIANLTLQTDQNITTLQGLQTSVNTQLAIAGTALTNDENNISALQTSDSALNSFETQQTALNAQLQSQITQLQQLTDSSNIQVALAQVDLNTQDISYIKTLLGVDPANPADVTLVGKFTAKVVNGGQLQITVSDEAHRTIGVATILAADADNGSDGKSVEVKNANVDATSKIFISFEDNPGSYSWVEKEKDSSGNYIGFKINLTGPVSSDTKADWWIVQENGSDDNTADNSSSSSSSTGSTSAASATTSATTDTTTTPATTTDTTTTSTTDTTTTAPATPPASTDTTTAATTDTASSTGTSVSTGV